MKERLRFTLRTMCNIIGTIQFFSFGFMLYMYYALPIRFLIYDQYTGWNSLTSMPYLEGFTLSILFLILSNITLRKKYKVEDD